MSNPELTRELLENRIVLLSGEIESELAKEVTSSLLLLDLQDKGKPITLHINSIGGDVECMISIYDTMQLIHSPVRTLCVGSAYSAAAILLAAGEPGLRYASKNSNVMIHQIRIDTISGSGTDMEIEVKAIKMLQRKLDQMLATHTGNKISKIKKDTNRDKYLTAEQAVKYGIIDEIIEKY